jgi:hypothetical protein
MNITSIIYFLIGISVSFLSIYVFRKDGTTKVQGELYWAVISPFIWPIVLIKLIYDKIIK